MRVEEAVEDYGIREGQMRHEMATLQLAEWPSHVAMETRRWRFKSTMDALTPKAHGGPDPFTIRHFLLLLSSIIMTGCSVNKRTSQMGFGVE